MDTNLRGETVTSAGFGPEQARSRILQLSDNEIVALVDTLLTAWQQREDAAQELQELEAEVVATGAPAVTLQRAFKTMDEFLNFNRQRREEESQREELTHRKNEAAERYNEAEATVGVLLPEGSSLQYVYEGVTYSIQNDGRRLLINASEPTETR